MPQHCLRQWQPAAVVAVMNMNIARYQALAVLTAGDATAAAAAVAARPPIYSTRLWKDKLKLIL